MLQRERGRERRRTNRLSRLLAVGAIKATATTFLRIAMTGKEEDGCRCWRRRRKEGRRATSRVLIFRGSYAYYTAVAKSSFARLPCPSVPATLKRQKRRILRTFFCPVSPSSKPRIGRGQDIKLGGGGGGGRLKGTSNFAIANGDSGRKLSTIILKNSTVAT
jgi:hypothetical protein